MQALQGELLGGCWVHHTLLSRRRDGRRNDRSLRLRDRHGRGGDEELFFGPLTLAFMEEHAQVFGDFCGDCGTRDSEHAGDPLTSRFLARLGVEEDLTSAFHREAPELFVGRLLSGDVLDAPDFEDVSAHGGTDILKESAHLFGEHLP